MKLKEPGVIDDGTPAIEVLARVRKWLEDCGFTLDPDKVFGGGVKNAWWLWMATRKHPLALAAFVAGVKEGDVRLYGKAWHPVVKSVRDLGLLPRYHQRGFDSFVERIGGKVLAKL